MTRQPHLHQRSRHQLDKGWYTALLICMLQHPMMAENAEQSNETGSQLDHDHDLKIQHKK
jgi:hypothetical protein